MSHRMHFALVVLAALVAGCGGGGDDPQAPTDAGRYALDVEASLSMYDPGAAQTENERAGFARANAHARAASENPRLGLTLEPGGTFALQVGSDETARGTWVRQGEAIQLTTTSFDGLPVEPPEVSEMRVVAEGALSFEADGLTVQLIRR